MEQAKRVAKNTGILYVRMAITLFISLYVTRLVLAALGAEDFGIFNVVGGAIMMLTFLNAAMASASQRFMSYAQGEGNNQKQKNIFNVSVLLHFLIAIVLVLLLESLGYILFNGVLEINPERMGAAKLIYQFLILSTFFTIVSVPYNAVINAHENMLFVAVLGIVESLLKLSIALYITYTNFDKLISYGFLMASLAVLLLLIQGVYCHLKYEEVKINMRIYYSKPLFKEMTSFASWSFLGSSSSFIAKYGQGIVLNMFFGTIVNAAQGISNQISGQLESFSSNMLKALNPVIVKNEGANNRAKMVQFSITGSKISFVLLALFAIPFMLEIEYIFNIWLIEVPKYAISFTILFLIGKLIAQLFRTLSTSIASTGEIKNYQIRTSIIEFLPLLIVSYLFTQGFSPNWLYVIYIIMVIIRSFGIILYYSEKQCGLKKIYFIKEVILPSIFCTTIAISFSLVPLLLMQSGFYRLLTITIIFISSFSILSYYSLFNLNEKNTFIGLINILKSYKKNEK